MYQSNNLYVCVCVCVLSFLYITHGYDDTYYNMSAVGPPIYRWCIIALDNKAIYTTA